MRQMRAFLTFCTILFFALLLAGYVLGCRVKQATAMKAESLDYVRAENIVRSELGIRTIPNDWILYRSEFGYQDWKKIETDRYLSKRVFKDDQGKITKEQDYYYSGKTFETREGRGWESFSVTYDYISRRLNVHYIGTNREMQRLVVEESGQNDVRTTYEQIGNVFNADYSDK